MTTKVISADGVFKIMDSLLYYKPLILSLICNKTSFGINYELNCYWTMDSYPSILQPVTTHENDVNYIIHLTQD